MYTVVYHTAVSDIDIPKLSKAVKQKIRSAIDKKLTSHPDIYGKPLRQSLKGYRSLRVGEYRVIFYIKSKKVFVLLIQHRSVVYEQALKRAS